MISSTDGLPNLTIDSGCTSTAVALKWKHLLTEVTDSSPSVNMYIADAKPLRVESIGKMELPCEGYHANDPTRTLIKVKLPSSRTLVVDGMDEGQILVSTRGLKRDGVNTYLNDDNSIKTSDCLYCMHEGMVIPFIPSDHSYNISMRSDTSHSSAEQLVTSGNTRYRHRPLIHIHRALGHSGAQRLGKSNILIDGIEVKTLGLMHDASSCRGCRLGNSGREANRRPRGAGRARASEPMAGDIVKGPASTGRQHERFRALWPADRLGHLHWIHSLIPPRFHEHGQLHRPLGTSAFHHAHYRQSSRFSPGRFIVPCSCRDHGATAKRTLHWPMGHG